MFSLSGISISLIFTGLIMAIARLIVISIIMTKEEYELECEQDEYKDYTK